MKKIQFFLFSLCMIVIQMSNGQSVQIGHRNGNTPVLDVNTSTFSTQVSSSLSASGFTFISINNLTLDDNPLNLNYFKNLSLDVQFSDAAGNNYSGSYYFTLSYDANLNKYYLDVTGGPLHFANGGHVTCSAENCKGCKPYKGIDGQPGGCTDCIAKVDPTSPVGPNCKQGEGNGSGGSGNGPQWITAIAALLDVFKGLF